MSEWIKCGDYEDLPEGVWLVRIDDEYHPLQVAYVSINKLGSKIITVGSHFTWDMEALIEYKEID